MPADSAVLARAAPVGPPRALVLMLHGGAQRSSRPVDGRSLALRRTRWMYESISPRLVGAGAAVALMRFRVRGWNAGAGPPAPVADARATLRVLRRDHGDLPIVLLGHSMGARAAAWVADEPGIVGVVGLAPWFPADDPVDTLAGRRLTAVHGDHDRITSSAASRRYVARAGRVAAVARFVDMGPLGHYMLSRAGRWNQVAVDETLAMLHS